MSKGDAAEIVKKRLKKKKRVKKSKVRTDKNTGGDSESSASEDQKQTSSELGKVIETTEMSGQETSAPTTPKSEEDKPNKEIMNVGESATKSSDEKVRSDDESDTVKKLQMENEQLKLENERLSESLKDKENFLRERETVNLEAYKHFKRRELVCRDKLREVVELYNKQIESYKKLLAASALSPKHSSGDIVEDEK